MKVDICGATAPGYHEKLIGHLDRANEDLNLVNDLYSSHSNKDLLFSRYLLIERKFSLRGRTCYGHRLFTDVLLTRRTCLSKVIVKETFDRHHEA